jgi:diguanylate cyclase (GGDEF)-like protein
LSLNNKIFTSSEKYDIILTKVGGVMGNRKLKEFVRNNRIVIFSGVFLVSLLIITFVVEMKLFKDTGRLTDRMSDIPGVSIIVVILSVLFITILNLRAVRKREKITQRRLQVSDTLINCITVLAEENDINKAIDMLLKILNDYFDGDRAYLFEFDYEKNVTNNSYEYAAEGVTKEIDKLQNIPLEVIDSWIRMFEETGTFYISSLDKDVDKDSDTYRILEMQQIQSLIAVPLCEDDTIIGFLGIDNPKINYDDLSLLSSATYFILDGIDRRESHAMLHRLSFEDTLTGVYNRNRFNHLIDDMAGRSVENTGVAFFDVNGLKRINDTLGHHEGDRLIKDTAEGICESFGESVYRIGGDEFVVVEYPVDEDCFREKVSSTVERLLERGISVSVGQAWATECHNIEALLSQADELMYKDKSTYYEGK